MAVTTHILYDQPEAVKKNFIRCKYPYYIVCDSKGETIWMNDEEDDLESAAELLFEDLKSLREYNNATYTIKHFKELPEKGLKKSTEPDCISTFKRGFSEEAKTEYLGNKFSLQNEMIQSLRGINDRMASIETRLALEDSEPDDEIVKQTTTESLIGAVTGNPQIMNLLTNIVANLFTNNVTPVAPLKLAGTEGETLETILERLFSKGVTVEDLKKLSCMEPGQISMLLNMLRAQ